MTAKIPGVISCRILPVPIKLNPFPSALMIWPDEAASNSWQKPWWEQRIRRTAATFFKTNHPGSRSKSAQSQVRELQTRMARK